jgi:eukaryotic-like serine/threonine-protein kinase
VLPHIDRYELTNEIGHGGMATVYRARDTRLDRWVAIKVMHPHLRGTEQARARFSREARAVARLRHPAILEIYDYSGHESDDAYIATELLTGPTLRVFVDAIGELPPEIAACIGVELACALKAAHAQGIIHRDVKPENVLLHENRTLKLTDFGIADMLDPSMSAMTATGQLLGSPAHMAPEQVESGDADARSDVFALGTILYWLGTGALPFSGKNPHQVLKRVVDCNPVDPLVLRPSLGRPLRDAICRCLAKDPDKRFQTADELSLELCRLLKGVGIDDPRAALEAYLRAPAEEARSIRTRVLAALLASARERVRQRERMPAIELLDRVLAIDDGNAEALKLVAQLDRAARFRIAVRSALALVGVLALAGMWIAYAPKSGAVSPVGEPRQPLATGPVAAPVAPAIESEPAVEQPSSAPAPSAPASTTSSPPTSTPATARPARPREVGPRTVLFAPSPANVTISVDGSEPRPYGPSFRMAELSPGPHRFRFVGGHNCCKPLVFDREIPPGPGETVIAAKLEFQDARLYVVTEVPADVVLDNGLLTGRTRSLMVVPIAKQLEERHSISVTAAGYEPYTGYVKVQAGEVTQHEVPLKRSDLR